MSVMSVLLLLRLARVRVVGVHVRGMARGGRTGFVRVVSVMSLLYFLARVVRVDV